MLDVNLNAIQGLHEAFNRHDGRAFAAHFAEEVVVDGRRAVRNDVAEVYADIKARFPDARREIQEIVAVDDHVITRSLYSGTHLGVGRLDVDGGQMIGAPATGEPFVVQHIDWYTLGDGLITEHRANRDDMSMLMQLGLAPAVPPVNSPARPSPVSHRHVSGTQAQARNLATVEAWNQAMAAGDLDAAVSCWSLDLLNHGRKIGPELIRMILGEGLRIYTNVDEGDGVGMREVVAVDDCVIARYERRVAHTGVGTIPIDGGLLVGKPATGRTFTMRHIHWFTLKDGLVIEHRACRDDVGMMVELGLMPAPAPPPADQTRTGPQGDLAVLAPG
jgi:predicted ester cyclase